MNIGPLILQGVLDILQNALEDKAASLNDAQLSNLAQRWLRYEVALGTLKTHTSLTPFAITKTFSTAYQAISSVRLTENQKKQYGNAKALFMLVKKVHLTIQEQINQLYFKQQKLEKAILFLKLEAKVRSLELDLQLAILLQQENLRQQKLIELQNLEPLRLMLMDLKSELDSIVSAHQATITQLHLQQNFVKERQTEIDSQLQSLSEQKTQLHNTMQVVQNDLQKIMAAVEKAPTIFQELSHIAETSNQSMQVLESQLVLWNKAEVEIDALKQQAKIAMAFEESYRPLEQVTKNLEAFLTREFFHITDILDFDKQNIPVDALLKHIAQNQNLLDAFQHLQLTPRDPATPQDLLQNLQQLSQLAKIAQTINHIFSPEEKGHAYDERFKIQRSLFEFSKEDYEVVRQLLRGELVIDSMSLEQEKKRLVEDFRKLQTQAETRDPLELEQQKETILAALKKIDQQQKLVQLNIPELQKSGIDILALMQNIEQGLDPNQIMQQSTHMLTSEDITWYQKNVVSNFEQKKNQLLQDYNISDRHALENVLNHKTEQVRIELEKIAVELQKDGKNVEISFRKSKETIQSLKNALDNRRQEYAVTQQKMLELQEKIQLLKNMIPKRQQEMQQKQTELAALENQYSKLSAEQKVCQKLELNLKDQEKLVAQKYELELALHQLKTQDVQEMQKYEHLVKKGELSQLPQVDKARALLKDQILEKKEEVKKITETLQSSKNEASVLTAQLQENTAQLPKEKVQKRVVAPQYREEKEAALTEKHKHTTRVPTPEPKPIKNKI